MVAAFRPLPWKDFRIFADETAFPEDRYAGARMRVTALGCNETVMGKMYRCLLLLTLAFFTFACEKGDDAPAPTPTPDVDRTVLVYLASDNNLYRFALQNLNDMKSAMEGLDGNLLVYIDEANGTSRLSKIESDGTERVIETYGKENSASAAVLRRVVDRVLTFYPAESYGLILWSHGMGWIPAGIEETGTSSGLCCPRDTEAYPVTKYFGADTENGSSVHMEIPDLVAALPDDLTFDFILFDMCSTRNTKIFSTLATQERTERTEYIIDDTLTKKYLHVCIKTIDDGPVHNCGRCYKCLRTLAAIDILGKLPEYETIFDQSYYKTHKAAIFAKYLGYRAADPFFADILNFAKQKGFRIPKMAYLLSVKYYLLLPAYMLGRELPNPTKKKIKKFLRMKG